MSSYAGRHAELYDLFYGEKPYRQEAAFLQDRIREFASAPASTVLELACGTGEHAFAFESLGYTVTATDYSSDMLAQARRKAVARGSSVTFAVQDMRTLDLRGPFDVVLCLFDAIGYVATNEALRSAFDGIARHLRGQGLFLFDFWHAPAMLRRADPIRVRRWNTDRGEILRIAETTLEVRRQIGRVRYSVYEHRADGTFTSFQEEQLNRYFLVPDMAAWLERSSLEPLAWYAGFGHEPITEDTFHVLCVARRT